MVLHLQLAAVATDFRSQLTQAGLTLAGALLLLLIGWLVRTARQRVSRLRLEIRRASARYLAYGLRMRRYGERAEPFGGMVPDWVPSGLDGALQLSVQLSLALRNNGPGTETLTDLELAIGRHDGKELVELARDDQGALFSKLEVKGQGGFETLDVVFIFGSDDYGDRGGWNYSDGAVYELRGTTSKGGRFRFQLDLTPPQPAEIRKPASVTWRRLRWRRRAPIAETPVGP